MKLHLTSIVLALLTPVGFAAEPAPTVRFERVVIDPDLADAYQVEVADVDGDGKPDIIALGNNTIAWYQNPTWTKRIIGDTKSGPLKADIISSATTDLDGDGRAEVAIACDFAMNTPTRGQLYLASQGATIDDPWTLRKIQDVPSIHRLRWADLEADGKPELIVAPIFGPKAQPPTYDQDLSSVVELRPDPAAPKAGAWSQRLILQRPVVHAILVIPGRPDPTWDYPQAQVFVANNAGLTDAVSVSDRNHQIKTWDLSVGNLVPGASGFAPKRGSSEVQIIGPIKPKIPPRFATIEPWHGSEVVIWQEVKTDWPPPVVGKDPEAAANRVLEITKNVVKDLSSPHFPYTRTVIDDTLDQGHALWTADVDGDGTDEIFAGHRGKDYRVAMYRSDGKAWNRTILDTEIAAQDLRGGDLDGDGVPDIVAVGGSTHNVVWYRPVRLAPAPAR